jgi:hypothetical protein
VVRRKTAMFQSPIKWFGGLPLAMRAIVLAIFVFSIVYAGVLSVLIFVIGPEHLPVIPAYLPVYSVLIFPWIVPCVLGTISISLGASSKKWVASVGNLCRVAFCVPALIVAGIFMLINTVVLNASTREWSIALFLWCLFYMAFLTVMGICTSKIERDRIAPSDEPALYVSVSALIPMIFIWVETYFILFFVLAPR